MTTFVVGRPRSPLGQRRARRSRTSRRCRRRPPRPRDPEISAPLHRLPPDHDRARDGASPSLSPGCDAGADRRLLAAAARDLDRAARRTSSPFTPVDDRTAVLLEDRLGRDERHVRQAVGRDARGRRHAGTDPRIAARRGPDRDRSSGPAASPTRSRRARAPRSDRRVAAKSLPGTASILTGRGLADLEPAAIGLVEPRLEMDRREVGQLEDAARRPRRDPLRGTRPAAAEHAAASAEFGRMLTMPSAGAFDDAAPRSTRCVRSTSTCALSRLRCLPTTLGVGAGLDRQGLRLDLLQPLFGVGRATSLRLFELDARDEIALAEIELRAIDVVLRLHQRRRLLLERDLRCCACDLLDLRVGLSSARTAAPAAAGAASSRRTRRRTSPVFTAAAVLRELDDLQLAAGLQRRREHDRLRRTDVAADLDVVDEVAARDVRRRDVRAPRRRASLIAKPRRRRRRRRPPPRRRMRLCRPSMFIDLAPLDVARDRHAFLQARR